MDHSREILKLMFCDILAKRFPYISSAWYNYDIMQIVSEGVTREKLIKLVTGVYDIHEAKIAKAKKGLSNTPYRADIMRDPIVLNNVLQDFPYDIVRIICKFAQLTNKEIADTIFPRINEVARPNELIVTYNANNDTVVFNFTTDYIPREMPYYTVDIIKDAVRIHNTFSGYLTIPLDVPNFIDNALHIINSIDHGDMLYMSVILTTIYLWRCYTM